MSPYSLMRITSSLVILVGFVAIAACTRVTRVPAEYCATVQVSGDREDADLAAKFDRFAIEKKLSVDKSNPAARDYKSKDEVVHISVSFGMGKFGAIVAFFRLDQKVGGEILRDLETFVAGDVARFHKVVPCHQIKGFRNPEMFI